MKEHEFRKQKEPLKTFSFSVVIPMYRAKGFIRRAVESVKAQSDADVEVWLMDDGSDDGTADFCADLLADDPRFHVVRRPFSGHAGVQRNAGLLLAQKDYILFLDADDELVPEAFALFSEKLNGNPDLDILCGTIVSGSLDEQQKFHPLRRFHVMQEADGVKTGLGILEQLQKTNRQLPAYSYSGIYRREFLLKHKLFQNEHVRLQEDHEWLPRVLASADKVAALDADYYHYIRRAGSITTAPSPDRLNDIANVVLEIGTFSRNNRARFSGPVLKFFSSHALNSLFWYFFHPLYRNTDTDTARCGILRSLIGDPAKRRIMMHLFRYASIRKKLSFLPLLLYCAGIYFPARIFFGHFYSRG